MRHLLSSPGSLRVRFSGFLGNYEVLRRPGSFSPRLVAFAGRYPPVRLSSSLPDGPTPAEGLELSGLAAPRQLFRTGDHRASQVPGEPRCAYALFLDPGRTAAPGLTTSAAWPPFVTTTRAPTMRHFRGSIAGPRHALSTLRRLGHPKTTQDSLLGAWPASQAGLATRRVPSKGFWSASYIPSSFPKLSGRNVTRHFHSPHSQGTVRE
jgi:hypothetical protein